MLPPPLTSLLPTGMDDDLAKAARAFVGITVAKWLRRGTGSLVARIESALGVVFGIGNAGKSASSSSQRANLRSKICLFPFASLPLPFGELEELPREEIELRVLALVGFGRGLSSTQNEMAKA